MSWYKRGRDGEARSEELERNPIGSRSVKDQRFWIKDGKSTRITFLDSEGFYFYEHQIRQQQVGGSFSFSYETCLSDIDNCPLCEVKDKPVWVCAYTIIDHTKFTTKDGNAVQNTKRLLVMKPRAHRKLKKVRDRDERIKGDLTNVVMEVSRDAPDEAATGEDFQYIGRLTKKQLLSIAQGATLAEKEEWLKPFNYLEIFAPKSADQLREMAKLPPPVGHSDEFGAGSGETLEDLLGGESADSEDDIPF